jgi:hypothetical protein
MCAQRNLPCHRSAPIATNSFQSSSSSEGLQHVHTDRHCLLLLVSEVLVVTGLEQQFVSCLLGAVAVVGLTPWQHPTCKKSHLLDCPFLDVCQCLAPVPAIDAFQSKHHSQHQVLHMGQAGRTPTLLGPSAAVEASSQNATGASDSAHSYFVGR